MVDERLCGTGIKHILDAGLDHLMQSDRVVPAVMEDLDYVFVQHQVPQDLAGEPEGLEISQLVHVPDID